MKRYFIKQADGRWIEVKEEEILVLEMAPLADKQAEQHPNGVASKSL